MKKNLDIVFLVINWVIVMIQSFTIVMYDKNFGLFGIMICATITQIICVFNCMKFEKKNENN